MPYKSRKVRNKNCYKVYKNDKTKKVFAKCATKENAQRQMRLLRAIQNNKNFNPNARRNMGGKSRKNKTLKIKGGVTNRPVGHIGFEQPAYPLQVNDYIRLLYGNFVYIFVIDGNSLRTQQHSLTRTITGVIISALGTNEHGFYHMIVTGEISGNSDSDGIQVGTVLLLPMLFYNSRSHPPITPDEQGSEETKTGDGGSDDESAVA